MRVDALHRRIRGDVRQMHEAVRESLPVQLPDHAINLKPFLDRLNCDTDSLGLFNELQADEEIPPGGIKMTGLWLAKSELPENKSRADVRILWHVHPETKRIQMTLNDWNRRRYFFWQTYMHELVHRYQEGKRPAKQDIRVYRPWSTDRTEKEQQEYYGNVDEIEAHSHDAAVEFMAWWGHLPLRGAMHEAIMYNGRKVLPTYTYYVITFDAPHPALRHFKRKLRAWYDVMRKNSDVYELLQLPNLVI